MKKNMMKKIAVITLGLTMLGGTAAHAGIIPPLGPGQIGYQTVVLCGSLTLHQSPDVNSPSVETLQYGDKIIMTKEENGWARCVLGDSEDAESGWVNADYVAIDPAWYKTNGDTPVYAWDDTSAPKVALLDEGTVLPILRDDGDWLIVSLRGAAGWIYNPDRTTTQNIPAGSTDASQSSSDGNEGQSAWITVYARNGDTVSIHSVGGAMYEDEQGRTYVKQDNDGYYYCIATDVTYAFDPGAWTGEAYGENEFPEDVEQSGEYYGENQQTWTGEDFGENSTLTGEDYGENQQ